MLKEYCSSLFRRQHFITVAILIIGSAVFSALLFKRALYCNQEGIYTAYEHIWADWPMHISVASIVAYKSPQYWFSYHPMYFDAPLTYPVLMDAFSGLFMRCGCSVINAFYISSCIVFVVLVVGMYGFMWMLFRSRSVALLAMGIFFLSSGPGFIDYLHDIFAASSDSSGLIPTKDYSRIDRHDWYAGNIVTGILLPQRAYLLGMPLALWSLAGLMWGLGREHRRNLCRTVLIVSGFLAGLLAVAHLHSAIVMVFFAGALLLVNRKQWRTLMFYAVPAVAFFCILYFCLVYGGIDKSKFFRFYPGWSAKGFVLAWLKMWWLIFGIAIPLAVASAIIFWKRFNLYAKAIIPATALLFTVANIILFQPVAWDNSKIFFWCYLVFSGLSAIASFRLWGLKKIYWRTLCVICLVMLTATGTLEITRNFISDQKMMLTNSADVELAVEIRQSTHPLALFLTDTSHNHFIMTWSARPIFLGFTPWVDNFGIDSAPAKKDLEKMFSMAEGAEELLKKYKVSFIVVGPAEKHHFQVDQDLFDRLFPVAFANSTHTIYDVRGFIEMQ
ncbi:MAG: hypothetical protein ACYTF1_09000 [Planctomycetota bacterium]|jgi:hypothetical protein